MIFQPTDKEDNFCEKWRAKMKTGQVAHFYGPINSSNDLTKLKIAW